MGFNFTKVEIQGLNMIKKNKKSQNDKSKFTVDPRLVCYKIELCFYNG